MKIFQTYGWVIKIVGAALLVGVALFLKIGDGEAIVIPFIGAVIVLSSMIRLVPFIKTQKSDLVKTVNIIEITIDVAIGAALILITLLVDGGLKEWFGYLLGIYFMLRGTVHFFSVSTHEEKSDLVLFFYHIATLIIGSYVFFSGDFTPAILINILLVFSIIAGGYLSYDGYKGYNIYRQYKQLETEPVQNQPSVEKELPETDETVPEEHQIVS